MTRSDQPTQGKPSVPEASRPDRAEEASIPRRHVRLVSELLGLPVLFADGRPAGHVNDIRLRRAPGPAGVTGWYAVSAGLVVGGRHVGSLLGYDRNSHQGPALVRVLVRLLHRHVGYVDWTDVKQIDWESRHVLLHINDLAPLNRAFDP